MPRKREEGTSLWRREEGFSAFRSAKGRLGVEFPFGKIKVLEMDGDGYTTT